MGGNRSAVYECIVKELAKLKSILEQAHKASLPEEATYLCEVLKPQMAAVWGVVGTTEGLVDASLYPYPTFETLIYSHHF